MTMRTVVIMLPCAGEFVHPRLKEELSKRYEIFEFQGRDQRELYKGLVAEVERVCAEGKTVALHGWSMGGGILLEYLASPHFKKHMSSIVAVLLYAAAGSAYRALPKGAPQTILYHNTNDKVIDSYNSDDNAKTLGGRARVHSSDVRHSGNNHQCNEFVNQTVEDLRMCDSGRVANCLKINHLEWGKVSLGDGTKNLYNGGDVIVAGTKYKRWDWKQGGESMRVDTSLKSPKLHSPGICGSVLLSLAEDLVQNYEHPGRQLVLFISRGVDDQLPVRDRGIIPLLKAMGITVREMLTDQTLKEAFNHANNGTTSVAGMLLHTTC
jgi:hypothetical protein